MGEHGLEQAGVGRQLAHDPDRAAAQIGDFRDPGPLGRDQHRRVAVQDGGGLSLQGHRYVGAHDREVGLVVVERFRAPGEPLGQHEPEADRGAFAVEVLRRRRHEARVLAAHRPDRDAQRRRPAHHLIGEQAEPEHG